MFSFSLLFFCIQSAQGTEIPIPVHGVNNKCNDPRFPLVLSEVVIGCGIDGEVDRAMSLHDQKVHLLPEKNQWSTGEILFRVGNPGGIWDLEEQRWIGYRIVTENAVATSKSDWIAVLGEEEMLVRNRSENTQFRHPARSIGWHPPAITNDVIAWIEGVGDTGQIVLWYWKEGNKTITISSQSPLYLYSSSNRLVWSEPKQIQIYHTKSAKREAISVENIQGIAVNDERICWSEWMGNDLDIRCDDGFHLKRKGNQQWPQLLDTGLYFREEGVLMWLPL